MGQKYTFEPIGYIQSPYKEKFAVPRQPGLVQDGAGAIKLAAPYDHPDTVRDLDQFSHVWVIFAFHQIIDQSWHPTVRPPRLGGNTHVSVFATRSPFRPNKIGLSLIELSGIRIEADGVFLDLKSVDLVNGTPVLDIKPYLPFAESLPHARAGFAKDAPRPQLETDFSQEALATLLTYQERYPQLKRFISDVLNQDPRPAYKKEKQDDKAYAVRLLEFDVHWKVIGENNYVTHITPIESKTEVLG